MDVFALQRAVWTSELEPLDRLVLLAIVSYWSAESPEPYPSWSALMQRTGLSRATLARRLQSLTRAGVVRVTVRQPPKGAQPTNHYDLTGLTRAINQSRSETSLGAKLVSQRDANQSQSETSTSLRVRPEVSKELSTELSPQPPKGAKAKLGKPSKDETDARIHPVVEFYASTFEREFHRKPTTNYPRAAKAIKLTPQHVSTEDLQRAIEVQLTQRRHDQFAGKDAQHVELHEIVGLMNRILAWTPRKAQGAAHTDEPVITAKYRRAGR